MSIWDPRSGLSTSTFYGHRNSCNSVCYTHNGSSLVSADADGLVKLWDVRMVAEVLTINCSKYPANRAVVDASSMVSVCGAGEERGAGCLLGVVAVFKCSMMG